MSIHGYLLSGSNLKKAKQLTLDARQQEGGNADLLFQQAFKRFAAISESYSNYADALYFWGFALFHQAQSKPAEQAEKILEEAISKFSLCQSIAPNHLGAVMDGGVALLGLAKVKQVDLDDEIYVKAKELFAAAEKIQEGSAAYNLACIYALQNDGDACLKALESARDHGLVPDEQNIVNDSDLQNVKKLPWFADYLKSLTVTEDVAESVEDEETKEDTAKVADEAE